MTTQKCSATFFFGERGIHFGYIAVITGTATLEGPPKLGSDVILPGGSARNSLSCRWFVAERSKGLRILCPHHVKTRASWTQWKRQLGRLFPGGYASEWERIGGSPKDFGTRSKKWFPKDWSLARKKKEA